MAVEVLNPGYEDDPAPFTAAPRLDTLQGRTVGVISNGKEGTVPFFDAVEDELRNTYGVADVVRVTKSNYSAPADGAIMNEAATWHAVIAGVGD